MELSDREPLKSTETHQKWMQIEMAFLLVATVKPVDLIIKIQILSCLANYRFLFTLQLFISNHNDSFHLHLWLGRFDCDGQTSNFQESKWNLV
jgi:hypothetical protein